MKPPAAKRFERALWLGRAYLAGQVLGGFIFVMTVGAMIGGWLEPAPPPITLWIGIGIAIITRLVTFTLADRFRCENCDEPYFERYRPSILVGLNSLAPSSRCEFCDFDRTGNRSL